MKQDAETVDNPDEVRRIRNNGGDRIQMGGPPEYIRLKYHSLTCLAGKGETETPSGRRTDNPDPRARIFGNRAPSHGNFSRRLLLNAS